MNTRNTDDLHQALLETPELDQFFHENETQALCQEMQERISQLCREKGISKSRLAKRACLSEVYLHQILSGRRTPSRNRLLCLCFALELTLEETQQLLRLGGQAQLYPKDTRDAIIEHGIVHQTSFLTLNQTLFSNDLEPLF